MKEKTKKYLIMTAYRGAVAVGLFAILWLIGFFIPSFYEKISPLWTKNINIGQVKALLQDLGKELFPF